jgi:hypothetical protein
MKQPKLKIGDRVKVIGTDKTFVIKGIGRNLNGKRIYKQDNGFWGNVRSELQKLTPKKEVKKWKYSREQVELWMGAYESYFPPQIRESYKKLRENLLAKSTPKKKSKEITPSLLNDIETIEEIREDGLSEYVSHLSFASSINLLIKNQRILTEILKEVMEDK